MPHVSFGFVAICLSERNCSPAGNVTVASLAGLDEEGIRRRIVQTAARNVGNTIRILHFLRGHGLELYRISANLIPLATHPATDGFAWWADPALEPLLVRLGALIRQYGVRVSSHLPQVCVLSTPDPSVLEWLLRHLRYHRILFETMGLDERAKLVMHVGGAYNDPAQALAQAEANFAALDPWARRRLVLENDDKTFSAAQVLALTRRLEIPMVFDYHHHVLRNGGEDLEELLAAAFSGWSDRPPKVHVSSPKSPSQLRAHADYVDWAFVEPFFAAVRRVWRGALDVMVEAKQKDLAALALRRDYEQAFGP